MPDDVIGIDVDHYLKGTELKEGAEQLDLITARCGSLPPTWSSTARGTEAGPGPSRTLFFRKRGGTKFPGNVAADIDILQRHHRYCVVAPSVHTTTGTPYRWYRPDGSPAADGEVPRVEDLPVLPRAWADYLMNPDPRPGRPPHRHRVPRVARGPRPRRHARRAGVQLGPPGA